jgi:hypothetical protein
VKKGKGRKLLLNVPSWYCDEGLGGPGVESVGCKICRSIRSPFVRKTFGFGLHGYLFEEDNITLILS